MTHRLGADNSAAATAGARPAVAAEPRLRRAVALVIALGAIGVLGLAAWMEPAGAGHGTHTQLGLPSCSWPRLLGVPCLTCGMTTSFALAADGRFLASLLNQPMGFLLSIVTAGTALVSLYVVATGSAAHRLFAPLVSGRGIWTWLALFGLAWAYKIVTF